MSHDATTTTTTETRDLAALATAYGHAVVRVLCWDAARVYALVLTRDGAGCFAGRGVYPSEVLVDGLMNRAWAAAELERRAELVVDAAGRMNPKA